MATDTGRRRGAMVENRHQPTAGDVTDLAHLGGRDMRRAHADGGHTIVTTLAGAQHFGMIHIDHGQPAGRCMTGITLNRGIQMDAGLACGDHTIVTALASAASDIVVDGGCRCPGRCIVAGLTHSWSRGHMLHVHARGDRAIVASGTHFDGGGRVIEHRHQPVGRRVASIAGQRRRNVIHTLAGRERRVVATLTTADGLGVVDGNQRYPRRVGVAGFAHITGIDVGVTFTDGGGSVVAGRTTIGNTDMIKGHVIPIHGDVAGIARFGGNDMRRLFADGDNTVMATLASTDDFRMIHRIHGLPAGRGVTGLAQIRCQNVGRPLAGGDHPIMASDTSAHDFGVIYC